MPPGSGVEKNPHTQKERFDLGRYVYKYQPHALGLQAVGQLHEHFWRRRNQPPVYDRMLRRIIEAWKVNFQSIRVLRSLRPRHSRNPGEIRTPTHDFRIASFVSPLGAIFFLGADAKRTEICYRSASTFTKLYFALN